MGGLLRDENPIGAEIQRPEAPRYIQRFTEDIIERKRTDGSWEAVNTPMEIEAKINIWLKEHGARLIDIKFFESVSDGVLVTVPGARGQMWQRQRLRHYLAVYEPGPEFEFETSTVKRVLPSLKLPENARAPTVDAELVTPEGRHKAPVMAGVFGVIEGMRLSKEDREPAPIPLLSPDCDLTEYGELFGNVRNVRNAQKQTVTCGPCSCSAQHAVECLHRGE